MISVIVLLVFLLGGTVFPGACQRLSTYFAHAFCRAQPRLAQNPCGLGLNAAPCNSHVEGKDEFRPRAPRLHAFQVDAVSSSLFQPVLTLLKHVELQGSRNSRLCSVDASVCVLENAMLSLSRAPSAHVCAAWECSAGRTGCPW